MDRGKDDEPPSGTRTSDLLQGFGWLVDRRLVLHDTRLTRLGSWTAQGEDEEECG